LRIDFQQRALACTHGIRIIIQPAELDLDARARPGPRECLHVQVGHGERGGRLAERVLKELQVAMAVTEGDVVG
jgi:hypothetical protein